MDQIIFRHGDVGLRLVEPGAEGGGKQVVPVRGRHVLAEGEQTGHAHTIDASACDLFEMATGQRVLVVHQETPLTHQEHNTINVLPGTYWVVNQREYAPGEIRRVLD